MADKVINGEVADTSAMLGQTHENGWQVDLDMVNHLQWYVDTLMKRDGTHKAEYFAKHPTLPLQGTMDHIGWRRDFTFLTIDDLKYGYLIIEPTSWQLVAYLFLILSNMPPERWPQLIQLSILQPRAIHKDGPYRRRVVSIADIQPELDQMQAQIERIVSGYNVATPGKDCYECPAATGCRALTESIYTMWEPIQSREHLEPTAAQLSAELVMLERMEAMFSARATAVRAEAEAKLAEGQFIPGWAMEKRWGKKKFTVDATSIQLITGIDPNDPSICTPAELIRRGAKKEVVDTITTKPYIGAKLSRVDESKIAAEFAAAQPKKGVTHE